MKKINKYLCIILSYNAEETIFYFLNRISKIKFIKKIDFILLDDCSVDKSINIAQRFNGKIGSNDFKIISNKKNLGFGGNLKQSYNIAIDEEYKYVATLHADGQYPPEYLEVMYDKLEFSDLVLGSRMMIKKDALKGKMPIIRFLGNIFLTSIQNFMFSSKLSEWHTGFRGFKVGYLKKIPYYLNSDYFDIDTQILIQFILRNFKINEFPIPTYYADEKSGVNLIKYGFSVLFEVLIAKLTVLKILRIKRYIINESKG